MKRHRRKVGRLRGKRTHGGGYSKKRRGRGSRMTNRRTFSTNIMHVLKYEPERIGRPKGFRSLKPKPKAINVGQLIKYGDEVDVVKLGYAKVLGGGKIDRPITVKAKAFTKSAVEKIEAAGGKAVVV